MDASTNSASSAGGSSGHRRAPLPAPGAGASRLGRAEHDDDRTWAPICQSAPSGSIRSGQWSRPDSTVTLGCRGRMINSLPSPRIETMNRPPLLIGRPEEVLAGVIVPFDMALDSRAVALDSGWREPAVHPHSVRRDAGLRGDGRGRQRRVCDRAVHPRPDDRQAVRVRVRLHDGQLRPRSRRGEAAGGVDAVGGGMRRSRHHVWSAARSAHATRRSPRGHRHAVRRPPHRAADELSRGGRHRRGEHSASRPLPGDPGSALRGDAAAGARRGLHRTPKPSSSRAPIWPPTT